MMRATFWNPKVRRAECLNRQAARSIVPIAELRTRMVMAGHSEAEIVSALKTAFDNKQLPDLESGNMVFMVSKSAYLFDAGDHNGPHVMFFTALKDGRRGLVSISVAAEREPSLAVPTSPLSWDESLTSVMPSTRQNASVSSVSMRLHWGQRFIFCSASYFQPGSPN